MEHYGLGCVKSLKDDRDFLMTSYLKYKKIPAFYDITSKMTPVKSQGQEGSCVGFAMTVGVKEYQEQIDVGKFVELSPRFLYEEAKKISGHKEGTTLKAAVAVAQRLGVCEEELWPYIADEVGSPAPKAYDNALKYVINKYARITSINELKQAIFDFGACMIGVEVYKGFVSKEAKGTGIVPDPTCWDRLKLLGGHAVTAVGYMDDSPYYKKDGHVKFKNSWGEKWGDSGYGYLSYKYIKNHMLDAFSCIDVKGSANIRPITVGMLSKKERKGLWV